MISQELGDKAPGVYITEVREIQRGGTDAPGLYQLQGTYGFRQLKKSSDNRINSNAIFINANSKSVGKAHDKAKLLTGNDATALFYCPSAVINDLGRWGASIRSQVTDDTVKELVNVLKSNASPQQTLSWVVEGQGAAVLNQAFQQYTGKLLNHDFQFINPETDISKLLSTLERKGAKLKGEIYNISSNNAALISAAIYRGPLIDHIAGIKNNSHYDENTRRSIIDQLKYISKIARPAIKQNTALKTLSVTFLQALIKAGTFRK